MALKNTALKKSLTCPPLPRVLSQPRPVVELVQVEPLQPWEQEARQKQFDQHLMQIRRDLRKESQS